MGCPFFGEINEPSSRAFWDDYDEDSESSTTISLSWTFANEVPLEKPEAKFTELLIIEGNAIANVITEILLKQCSAELVATLMPSKSVNIYKYEQKLICVYDQKDISDSGEIFTEMIQFLEIPKISTLNILSKTQYKTRNLNEIEDNFLRGINSESSKVKQLRSPNFIAGLCAGVASWRKSNNKDTHIYILYTDGASVDRATSKTLSELFCDIGYKSQMLSGKARQPNQSYLYM